jgi:hypothetical protein
MDRLERLIADCLRAQRTDAYRQATGRLPKAIVARILSRGRRGGPIRIKLPPLPRKRP